MAGRPAFDATYIEDARRLAARGLTRAEIARRLGTSERTVYRLLGRRERDG